MGKLVITSYEDFEKYVGEELGVSESQNLQNLRGTIKAEIKFKIEIKD